MKVTTISKINQIASYLRLGLQSMVDLTLQSLVMEDEAEEEYGKVLQQENRLETRVEQPRTPSLSTVRL